MTPVLTRPFPILTWPRWLAWAVCQTIATAMAQAAEALEAE